MIGTMDLNHEERIECANYINQQGKRLERLSHKMLELVGIAHDETEWKLFSIGEVVKGVQATVQKELEKNKIILESLVEDEILFGEEDFMVSLLLNLVDNARKAIGKEGRIRIEGKRRRKAISGYGSIVMSMDLFCVIQGGRKM